jgi:hypothetical protein
MPERQSPSHTPEDRRADFHRRRRALLRHHEGIDAFLSHPAVLAALNQELAIIDRLRSRLSPPAPPQDEAEG